MRYRSALGVNAFLYILIYKLLKDLKYIYFKDERYWIRIKGIYLVFSYKTNIASCQNAVFPKCK